MTAPSNANTSGLEVVAWRWKGFDGYFVVNPNQPKPFDAEPLVTAASAQARIVELEAENESHRSGGWILAEMKRRQEAEARADRLAKALKETRNRVREWPIDDHETCMCGSPVASHGMGDGHSPVSQGDHAISMIVEAINEALQQETQP